jgi:hypothetical protein
VLTLKKLGEQLAYVRESLRNAGLLFVEAEKTVTISRLFFVNSKLFCRLQCSIGYAVSWMKVGAGCFGTDSSSY